MKTQNIFTFFALSLTMLLALTAFASADLVLTDSTVEFNGNHDSEVLITFELENTDSTSITDLSWAGTDDSIGQWKDISSLSSNIGSESKRTFVAKYSIPEGTEETILNPSLRVSSTSAADSTILNVEISVQATPSLSISKTQDLKHSQDGIITITNNGNEDFISSPVVLSSSGSVELVFKDDSDSTVTNFPLLIGDSKTIKVTADDLSMLKFGTDTLTVTATSDGTTASESFTLTTSFCKSGPVGVDLTIKNVDIENSGEKDHTWNPLDRITIEVEVENENDDDDIDEVIVELGIFDNQGRNLVGDLDFENDDEEEFDVGDINDNDEETITFEFQVPGDFEDGNYKLALKVYSDDLGEENLCSDSSNDLDENTFEEIKVELEEDEEDSIAYGDISFRPSEVTCGESVTLSFDVFNIGEDDQDQIRVNLDSRDLSIDLSQEIRQDLDSGDDRSLSFTFKVPEVNDGLQRLELSADMDYRNGVYRKSSSESTNVFLNVFGCSGVPSQPDPTASAVSISARLDSDVSAGTPLVVTGIINSLSTSPETYLVTAKGFESWASLDSVSPRVLPLGAGESSNVKFSFTPDANARGEQTFTIEVKAGSMTETREVVVDFGSAQAPITGGAVFGGSGDSTLIWVIGIVNVILIILIIVVAVRIARR